MMNENFESSTVWYFFHVILNLLMVVGLFVVVKRIPIDLNLECLKNYLYPWFLRAIYLSSSTYFRSITVFC